MTQRQIENEGFFSFIEFNLSETKKVKVARSRDDVFIEIRQNNSHEIFTSNEWSTLTSFVNMCIDVIKPCKKESKKNKIK